MTPCPRVSVLLFVLFSVLILPGANGGCGGGPSEPLITSSIEESACPVEIPVPWSECTLGEGHRCHYEKITCCTEDGRDGAVHFSTIAECTSKKWVILMARIECEHGYWPDNCSE